MSSEPAQAWGNVTSIFDPSFPSTNRHWRDAPHPAARESPWSSDAGTDPDAQRPRGPPEARLRAVRPGARSSSCWNRLPAIRYSTPTTHSCCCSPCRTAAHRRSPARSAPGSRHSPCSRKGEGPPSHCCDEQPPVRSKPVRQIWTSGKNAVLTTSKRCDRYYIDGIYRKLHISFCLPWNCGRSSCEVVGTQHGQGKPRARCW